MPTITLTDEHGIGNKTLEQRFEIPGETLTLRELLRRRIYEEANDYNAAQTASFQGLVQPEKKQQKRVDWQKQFAYAQSAFERRAFIVLVDDEQVDELDTPVRFRAGTQVTFLKLVPLVGG